MTKIFKKLFDNPWGLSVLAGISVFISFETFRLVWALLFFPFLFTAACFQTKSFKQSVGVGFITSTVIMLGGFYWITYVVHEFGQLSWGLSGLLFFMFCGFGALNFPVFSVLIYFLKKRLLRSRVFPFWAAIGIPALFTSVEWLIPKLFPWFIGHSLYKELWLIQLIELTGASLLTFSVFSFGLTGGIVAFRGQVLPKISKLTLLFPLVLFSLQVFFSYWTHHYRKFDLSQEIKIGLVQANIGSLDKLAAHKGLMSKVDFTIKTYQSLTDSILFQKPDLILWPETAIPFQLNTPSLKQKDLLNYFLGTGVPFIVGAYAQSPYRLYNDYNAAFLIDPQKNENPSDAYFKNILLAFGEYLPLGSLFPTLYALFPQVSDFERGDKQNSFLLNNRDTLGISICYEAIVPSFMRKIARKNIKAFINLTNDSWFGPTSEPYLHGSLTVFRAIEHRIPLARVTNTGSSFVVDHLGRMSERSSLFESSARVHSFTLVNHEEPSFYARFGDWFVGILTLAFLLFLLGEISVSLSR